MASDVVKLHSACYSVFSEWHFHLWWDHTETKPSHCLRAVTAEALSSVSSVNPVNHLSARTTRLASSFQRVTGTAFWAQVCLQFFPSFCSSFTVAFSKEAAWSCIAQSISEESPCICLPRSTGKWPSLIFSVAVGVYWWIGLFHDKYLPGNSYLIREFLRKIQLVFSSLSWVGAL